MQQEYREIGLNGFWTNVAAEALDVETARLLYEDGRYGPKALGAWKIQSNRGVAPVLGPPMEGGKQKSRNVFEAGETPLSGTSQIGIDTISVSTLPHLITTKGCSAGT